MPEIVNCDTCGARKEVTIGVKHGEGLYFKAEVLLLPERTLLEDIRWAFMRYLRWNAEGRPPYHTKQGYYNQLGNHFHYYPETDLWSFDVEYDLLSNGYASGKFKVDSMFKIEIMGMVRHYTK